MMLHNWERPKTVLGSLRLCWWVVCCGLSLNGSVLKFIIWAVCPESLGVIVVAGFPCDYPGELTNSLPGHLNAQWRTEPFENEFFDWYNFLELQIEPYTMKNNRDLKQFYEDVPIGGLSYRLKITVLLLASSRFSHKFGHHASREAKVTHCRDWQLHV